MGDIADIIKAFTSRCGFDAVWDECDEDIRREIRAAIRAALAERQRQPIETAPRDGSEVLVWDPTFYQGRGGWAVALWHSDAWRMPSMSMLALQPTHWMPLPAGPEVADG